ncbi:hypothetical protein QQS21_008618 [Conoideocrella luteorostrata]|uniref:Peptidase A1 domain-containing protein n=1 Tax=Conoideocrella luteorostrata TaxID=1105319 RepID=A0AAJ0CII8_9HYPO|nr:hypothetical protein QQS21_008618 [Conoideocrella luteorostrata]
MGFIKFVISMMLTTAIAAPSASKKTPSVKVAKEGILQLSLFTIPPEIETNLKNKTKRQASTELENYMFEGSKPIKALGIILEIGTPPQKVIVEPDTASEILWIQGLPDGKVRDGSKSTYFEQKASRSLQNLKRDSFISYVGQQVALDMFADTVSVGGVSLGNMSFGIANMKHRLSYLSRNVGTMGLTIGETNDGSVLAKLKEKHLVKNRAYSMALRKKDQGAVTFGGYDTSKFSGPLEMFAIEDQAAEYVKAMQSLSFSNGSTSHQVVLDENTMPDKSLTVGLDSGSPGLIIPQKYQDRINDNECRLAIAFRSGGLGADLWIGGHFLRRSLVIYDPDQDSVYVARGADCGSTMVAMDETIPKDLMGKCKEEIPELDPPAEKAAGYISSLSDEEIESLIIPA